MLLMACHDGRVQILYQRTDLMTYRWTHRHGVARPRHPRLYCEQHEKTWMAGTSPAMTMRGAGESAMSFGPTGESAPAAVCDPNSLAAPRTHRPPGCRTRGIAHPR